MRLARQAHLQAEEQKLKEEICRAVEAEERDRIRQEEQAERMREKYLSYLSCYHAKQQTHESALQPAKENAALKEQITHFFFFFFFFFFN